MSGLRYDAIVCVLNEHEEDAGWHFFVMEYLDGGDLRKAVLDQRIGPNKIWSIMLPVCPAMAEAPKRGIVHRAIKPANILLHASGDPNLTDFDLVAAEDTTGGTGSGPLGSFMYT